MVEKLQKAVRIALVLLTACLVYRLYGEQICQGLLKRTEPPMSDESEEDMTETKRKVSDEAVTEEALPASYDARQEGRAPLIKNQGSLGTCWAVTASSALEAALLPKEHLIFSADHISRKNAYGKTQEEGGAYPMTMSYLAGWLGPVTEEEDPYGDGESPEGLSAVRHVQEIRMLKEKNIEKIKQYVYRFGAVQSSLYMDMMQEKHSSVYYNEFEHAYCYAGEEQENHDVLIIGWDDDYPKDNFSVQVKGNGAFLCQNSWGTSFGEQGVFYVSYEDAVLGNTSIAYTKIEDNDNYDHLYQSDLCGWIGQVGYDRGENYFANVYDCAQNENLEAVGFYATGRNTKYQVYVAEDYTNTLSLIGKQELASGVLEEIGYYTIPLRERIPLQKGKRFAIIVKISTEDNIYPIATEYRADEDSQNVDITDGEGYISSNGVIWTNTEETHQCNVCLKAYTSEEFPQID